jgi:hypothetical protein
MAQLRKLDVTGAVACFLAPAHASAIRVALDRLRPEQAVIAIVPDEADLHFMLHCEDFLKDVAAHRIYFVAGSDWSTQLRELFLRISGLSIPSQFIRVTSNAPEVLDSMITEAQRVFSHLTTLRAEQIQSLRNRSRAGRSDRLCVVGASQRRLWNDWGAILAVSVCDENCVRVDPDDPRESAPLAVARAAVDCDAIVTVDISRAHAPGIVADELPWVTWVTNGSVPARSACGQRDRLLLLDENDRSVAIHAGWEKSEVRIAKPQAGETLFVQPSGACSGAPFIAIVADTLKLEPPANINDFSSHRLLWELVSDELTRNPFAIGDDVDAYLTSRMRKLDVSEQTLNRAKFISHLIVPAYQRGLLRTLNEANIPVRVLGQNWEMDAIHDRSQFARELASSVALLHPFPNQRRVHAIDFASRTVIRPGRSGAEMIRRCREALSNPQTVATSSGDLICAPLIRELIASI